MSREVVAEMLRRAFNALGIKQTELATRLGVDPGTVNKWLKGSQLPSPEIIPDLAQKLGLDDMELCQAVMVAQRAKTSLARREAVEARSRTDRVLNEMREVVRENRDINDQIGRDIAELRDNLNEISKEFRQVNQTLARIAAALEAQTEDARSH